MGECPGVAQPLARRGQPGGAYDDREIVDGPCKVLIHNNIIELAAVAHLLARRGEPLLDDRGGVLATLGEPILQCFDRRRQDENMNGIRHEAPYLGSPLPVDFEQHVLAGGHLRREPRGRRSVPIAMDKRVLQKFAIVFQRYEGMTQDGDGIWQAPSGALVAWFRDPDGHVLSLTQFEA